jgi:hypothetical protein
MDGPQSHADIGLLDASCDGAVNVCSCFSARLVQAREPSSAFPYPNGGNPPGPPTPTRGMPALDSIGASVLSGAESVRGRSQVRRQVAPRRRRSRIAKPAIFPGSDGHRLPLFRDPTTPVGPITGSSINIGGARARRCPELRPASDRLTASNRNPDRPTLTDDEDESPASGQARIQQIAPEGA